MAPIEDIDTPERCRERAQRCRTLAEAAVPAIARTLIELAETYERIAVKLTQIKQLGMH